MGKPAFFTKLPAASYSAPYLLFVARRKERLLAGAEATRLPRRRGSPVDTSMPAIVRSEFALALNQVATERGIDPSVVVETIKAAIIAAYRMGYDAAELETLTV